MIAGKKTSRWAVSILSLRLGSLQTILITTLEYFQSYIPGEVGHYYLKQELVVLKRRRETDSCYYNHGFGVLLYGRFGSSIVYSTPVAPLLYAWGYPLTDVGHTLISYALGTPLYFLEIAQSSFWIVCRGIPLM